MTRDADLEFLGFPVGNPLTVKSPVGNIPTVATAAELCALTGVSDNAGRDLASRKIWVRTGKGFDTQESIRNHVRELSRAAKRGSTGSELDREKVRVQKATAEKLELANAEARGDLIAAADVERRWATILRDVRAAVLAIPSRVGSRLPHLTAHDVGEIGREIADALADLADKDKP